MHSDGGWADAPPGPRAIDPGRQNRHQHLSEAAAADRIYFVSTDHLGTPQELVDEDGKIVWLAKYRAWGRINALDRAEVAQPLRFQGQYEDDETGLYYNRHRYYDPDSSRYVTADPLGLLAGENSYQYASNTTSWVDPLGLCRGLLVPADLPKNIHMGQQGKHIPGHNNYIPGKSPLSPDVDPQELLDGVHSGDYPIVRMTPREQPVVDFGRAIGEHEGKPTQYGIIHHGKKGAHIVAANPVQY